MLVKRKSQREIELMQVAGNILATAHYEMAKAIKPGISTKEIDEIGEATIRRLGGIPSCLNYHGFPAAICISVNDEVVHGIPSRQRILEDGDIVSLDACAMYKGYHSDMARTHIVGNASPEAQRLVEVTRQSFFEALKYARPGYHIVDISEAVEDYVVEHGYSVVEDLTGHGIGKKMHERPMIPNYATRRKGIKLKPGMTLAIEPMVNEGGYEVVFSTEDGWTVTTLDGSLSAHYENTVLITQGEPIILSRAEGIEI